jgi:hypothetical protein
MSARWASAELFDAPIALAEQENRKEIHLTLKSQ